MDRHGRAARVPSFWMLGKGLQQRVNRPILTGPHPGGTVFLLVSAYQLEQAAILMNGSRIG